MSQDKLKLKQHFDRIAVDIGTGMFSLQMALSDFVFELLGLHEDRQLPLDLSVPHLEGESYAIIRLTRIFFDTGQDLVYVETSSGKIIWGDLNILAQDIIATYLHMQFTADNILGELS